MICLFIWKANLEGKEERESKGESDIVFAASSANDCDGARSEEPGPPSGSSLWVAGAEAPGLSSVFSWAKTLDQK